MKTKKGFLVLAVTVISSLFLFTSCKEHHTKGAFMLDYISESLDLTEQQEIMLDDIKDEIVAKMKELQGEKGEVHTLLKEQLAGDILDEDFIRQVIAEHREKKDVIVDLAVDRFIEFHSQLNPEQRAKIVAKLEKFAKHHSHPWQE